MEIINDKSRDENGYSIRDAESADFPSLHELLEICQLTTAGVDPTAGSYFAAVGHGSTLGMVGLEIYGSVALLRSFAVRPEFRGKGVGKALVGHLLARAKEAGLSPVYLLTHTAEPFFTSLGFVKITRAEIPSPVLKSLALCTNCHPDSVCMKLE